MDHRDQPSDQTDAQLLIGSVDGVSRFAVLYDRHVAAVLAYFVRRTGCAQTAADLTAETFAAAFSSRRRFRDTGAPARAWLFTIARRQLTRFVRRQQVETRARRRLGVPQIELEPAELERVERLADVDHWRPILTEALGRLPDGQSEAVRLRVGEDLPFSEVARRLGCSEGAARVRVSRALTRLANDLEGA